MSILHSPKNWKTALSKRLMLFFKLHACVHMRTKLPTRPSEGIRSRASGVTLWAIWRGRWQPKPAAHSAEVALCGSGAPREWRSALALSQLSNPFSLISVSASGFFTEADKRSHLWILQAYGKAHRESTYAQNTHLGQEVARTEKSGGTYHLPPSHPLHALSRVLSHLTGLWDTKWVSLHRQTPWEYKWEGY